MNKIFKIKTSKSEFFRGFSILYMSLLNIKNMNNIYLKAFALHLFLFSVICSIMIANTSIIPICVVIFFFFPIKKMLNTMTESEIQEAMGIAWLQNKFKNNDIIMDMTNE